MNNPLISITKKQALLFAAFLVLYEFLTYIANDMVMPAMIHVVDSFNASKTYIATSLTVYILGGTSLQIILGPLSDRYGRRPMMILGACLFFLFTLWIAHTSSMHEFLIARFFQGMGLCFITVIGYATIQEIYAEMDAIRLTAFMSNIAILAPLLGPLLGTLFLQHYQWPMLFYTISFFAFIAMIGLIQYMPESLGKTTTNGQTYHAVPLSWQRMGKNYKDLLTNKKFILYAIALGLVSSPGIIWIALSPLMFVTYGGYTMVEYACWQIPLFGFCILGNLILRYLTYHFKIEVLVVIGVLVNVIGISCALIGVYFYNGYLLAMMPGLLIYFAGWSLASAPLTRIALFSTHVTKGTASALESMIVCVIPTVMIEISNSLYHMGANTLFALINMLIMVLLIMVILFANPGLFNRGRKGFLPPLPPNRTCGSPAYGSPVGIFLTGTDALVYELALL